MFLWYFKIPLILLLWCVSILLCDIRSATFVEKNGSVLEIVFFINVVGCLIPGTICLLCRRGSWCKMWHTAITFYESTALLKLFLAVCYVNVLATGLFFFSFTLSSMTHAYAIKTTEPLVMCLLSTEIMQRAIRGFMIGEKEGKSYLTDGELHLVSPKTISFITWISVFFVCIGALLISGSLERSGETVRSDAAIMFTYCLVFASSCALALRTTLMKPLLHTIQRDGSIFPAAVVHCFMMFCGSVTLLGPALVFRGRNIVGYNLDVWKQIVVVGLSYGVYQVVNGVLLFYVTPLSYSILKQVRVVLIFFCSAYYFGKEFAGVARLIVGLLLLFGGSYCYVVY
ncbi:hypothetical protein TraAM80_01247 [Trypanosoma rangeli]|uniref:Uncharacterized protein n=1 Tax=Trypanosoma rangeli TaxID=5698 RepID=A0A3R7MT89_TRYRA|nr:uncharacterized protein TraAM80_01247 [Trypanosoma rangeli]RNF10863.1 hypothetical protein TraAM80_01247 [Trypanosoma rangeli]|eukprot:RNF10863.1 hypothetical protein TraAM80_01247 [Trypanosoma rangeli]